MGDTVKKAALSEMEELIRSKLSEGGSVKFSPKGRSMLPMLREEGDSVTLIKPPARLKKGMVALFISEDGGERIYTLHRLVSIRGGRYYFCGDNRKEKDEPASYGDIIGVVAEFETRGEKHSVKEFGYRLYSLWMISTAGFRKSSVKVQNFILRTRKKLRK